MGNESRKDPEGAFVRSFVGPWTGAPAPPAITEMQALRLPLLVRLVQQEPQVTPHTSAGV